MKPFQLKPIMLFIVLLTAFYFRFTGLNWDQNQHLHPDERFLTMVALSLRWPGSLYQYFDTSVSSVNPHNRGHEFFVYGTYPVLIIKALSEFLNLYSYNGVVLVGRAMSGLFDLGTVLLVFLISRRLFCRFLSSLWAPLFYTLSVLPIQLSHFFANDTFLVFFLTLNLYCLLLFYQKPQKLFAVLLGVTFGLSFAAKVNAILMLPVISLAFAVLFLKKTPFTSLFHSAAIFTLSTLVIIRLAYPYLFSGWLLNPKLLANWTSLQRLGKPDYYFPPSVQWVNINPGIFPLKNFLYWGVGFPLGVVSLIALVVFISKFRRSFFHLCLPIFVLTVFLYQSLQPAQPLRYFYPAYPLLAVMSGWLVSQIRLRFIHILLFLSVLIYPLSFLQIYHRPHTRISASRWMYENIPVGSTLSCEYWDDCLPLILPLHPVNPYRVITLTPYDPETQQKWQDLSQKISSLDYIVLTSNRLYGSISSSPEHYPQTTNYYRLLFSGRLGFMPIIQFTSRPSFPSPVSFCLNPLIFTYGRVSSSFDDCSSPGISYIDDYADETFTVYDHPKVTIFQNTGRLTPAEIYTLVFSKT